MRRQTLSAAPLVVFIAMGAALVSSTATAQPQRPRQAESPPVKLPAPPPGKPTDMLEGAVKKVDPAAGTLEVSSGPLGIFATTLEVNGNTQVKVEGRQGSISDLREGAKINVSYDARDGRNVATRIEVMPSE
jgi:hypothetical protein